MASEAIEADISVAVVLVEQLQVQTNTAGARRYNLCACFREHQCGSYNSEAHPEAKNCFLGIVDHIKPIIRNDCTTPRDRCR